MHAQTSSRASRPSKFVARFIVATLVTFAPWCKAVAADFNVLFCMDPSDRARSVTSTVAPAASLSKLTGANARIVVSYDLKDCMRATRTSENQAIIGPAHVMASALSHGYVLAAASGNPARYALVTQDKVQDAAALRGKRLYLPQQDSLRSYLARGLLEQSDLSLKHFKKTEYQNTSGAGLIAIGMGMSDATVAELNEAQTWIQAHPGKARIIATSKEVPGGLGLAVHKSVLAADRERIARWAAEAGSPLANIVQFRAVPMSSALTQSYAYVASLGIVTPDKLPGAKLVSAEEVRALLTSGGVTLVDTRSAKEFATEHIIGAVLAPYVEKSLKERDYDVSKDDLSAFLKLDRNKPTVFLCNGPECWKSYKASREALNMGFKTVYWFRGGMPEWRSRGLPTAKEELAASKG